MALDHNQENLTASPSSLSVASTLQPSAAKLPDSFGSPFSTQSQSEAIQSAVNAAWFTPCSMPADQCALLPDVCSATDCLGWGQPGSGNSAGHFTSQCSGVTHECHDAQCDYVVEDDCAGCAEDHVWLSCVEPCPDSCSQTPPQARPAKDCSQCADYSRHSVLGDGGLMVGQTAVPTSASHNPPLSQTYLMPHTHPAMNPAYNIQSDFPSMVSFGQPRIGRFLPTTSLDLAEFCASTPSASSGSSSPYSRVPSANAAGQLPSAAPKQHFCLWGACRETFESHQALVRHVNTTHLGPPQDDVTSLLKTSMARSTAGSAGLSSLLCHWGSCEQPKPGSSSAPHEAEFSSLTGLATHLLQEHLGIPIDSDVEMLLADLGAQSAVATMFPQTPNPPLLVQTTQSQPLASPAEELTVASEGDHENTDATMEDATPIGGTLPRASSGPTIPSVHRCEWAGCVGKEFGNVDALSQHIIEEHVGGGKASYECLWAGCDRQGSRAFTSKQKILRHLQSHTGHRPFQCTICGQHFSEAATLQQHHRRHTSEKPFKCDHPGCGKSFAVAGALTIHKRTHTGMKPFKCTYCDKAFAESSNLSKHLRTHTGVKPYACTHPGCSKTFSRPDQLNRHRLVHTRTRAVRGVAAADSETTVSDD